MAIVSNRSRVPINSAATSLSLWAPHFDLDTIGRWPVMFWTTATKRAALLSNCL